MRSDSGLHGIKMVWNALKTGSKWWFETPQWSGTKFETNIPNRSRDNFGTSWGPTGQTYLGDLHRSKQAQNRPNMHLGARGGAALGK